MSTIEAGPTQERLKQADGHVSVGGEKNSAVFVASTCRSGHIDRSGGRGLGTLMTGGGVESQAGGGAGPHGGSHVRRRRFRERGRNECLNGNGVPSPATKTR